VPHPRTVRAESRLAQPLCENPLANDSGTADRICTIPITTVPKKSKSQSPTPTAANDASNPPAAATDAPKSAAKKRTTKAKTASTKAAATKKSGRKTAKPKTLTKNTAQTAETREPSDADIRLRAYFIAEKRVQLALQGDPAMDWIEARQQLLQESRQGRP
jgi:hypothetical protein